MPPSTFLLESLLLLTQIVELNNCDDWGYATCPILNCGGPARWRLRMYLFTYPIPPPQTALMQIHALPSLSYPHHTIANIYEIISMRPPIIYNRIRGKLQPPRIIKFFSFHLYVAISFIQASLCQHLFPPFHFTQAL